MIRHELRTLNGKFQGVWYHFPDGRQMYLAHYSGEKAKGLVRDGNAWYMDVSVLREAERRGCEAIGVLHRIGKHKYFYLANRADFWGAPDSGTGLLNSMAQRTLPRSKFLVNPSTDRKLINSAMRIQ